MTKTFPSEAEVRRWLESLSNWGRFGEGADGLVGTLAYITPDLVADAARLVSDGVSVSCSLPYDYAAGAEGKDETGHLVPESTPFPVHYMIGVDDLESVPRDKRAHPMDGFLIQPHGQLITHLDAPCHTVYDGTLFNGVPSSEALTPETALLGGVELATRGVLGRGVLLDVAALRGRPWLEDDEVILPEDLDACEQLHGVRVGRGDCLLVRTGYRARNLHGLRTGPDFKRPGLQAACLPWLHEREIGLLAADVAIDCMPHGYDSLGLPVHTVGMWAIGLWLLDNCWLEDLSQQCAAARRYEFLFAVSPLLLRGGTGSPVNPLAVF